MTTSAAAGLEGDLALPRTIAVWLADWPVTAAASAANLSEQITDRPMAVLVGNRVVASNDAARQAGVRRGHRKREAQYRCPSLLLLPRDPAVEARAFEPVVAALEQVAAGVEITRPGLAALGARGLARYYHGEQEALAVIARTLHGAHAAAHTSVLTGIADGAFTAALAARTGEIVPAGGSPEFLAPLPITVFGSRDDTPLVDLLLRLGIRSLGAFAALPARDIAARFGPEGAWAHRVASGRDDRPLAARTPPPGCDVTVGFEPPLDRADTVAFSTRAAAEQFVEQLADRGAACVCIEVEIALETGEHIARRWRHTGLLGSVAVVDRIRWQLEGLFTIERAAQESGAVTALTLRPIETVPVGTHQLTLWGGTGERDERAELGIARLQSTYGHASVQRLIPQGDTGPATRTATVPWGEPTEPDSPRAQPWPGRLPAPAPTVVFDPPTPLQVLDETGAPVIVTDRGALPRPPAAVSHDGRRRFPITAWTGPWPDSEQFWNPDAPADQRRVRCQLVDAAGRAYVASCRAGSEPDWLLEGVYD